MGRLNGHVAVVTGAASGIGAACVERFHREGAHVVGLDLTVPATSRRTRVEHREVDVTDEAAVAAAFASIATARRRIDIVVNAAGVGGGAPVHMLEGSEWDRIIDVNLKGTFHVAKAAVTIMLDQPLVEGERGTIVNLASVEGLEGMAAGSAYNASKGGVVLLTRNMAIDYGRMGIRVNALCPGLIRTPMTSAVTDEPDLVAIRDAMLADHKLGRFGEPEEVAAAALFLASRDASFISGVALPVDGGYTAGRDQQLTRLFGLDG